MTTKSDNDLMLLYQAGNAQAFEELYKRYAPLIKGYLSKRGLSQQACNDVFQNILLKLHRTRQRFDPCHTFSAWIFTLSRTSLIDFLRQSYRHSSEILDETKIASDQKLNREENSETIVLAAHILSEKEQTALKHRYIDNHTFDEIARLTGSSEVNLRKMVSRSLKKIKKYLEGEKNEHQ